MRFHLHAVISFFALIISAQNLHAQREYDVWYFGPVGGGISFKKTGTDTISGGMMRGLAWGTGLMCDRNTGALLFYSNGLVVANREHRQMPNGALPDSSDAIPGCQVAVPDPNDSMRYYLFTNSNKAPYRYGLSYSIIDMRLDSGRGDVVVRDVRLFDSARGEKLCAVRHCNGSDYWIITLDARRNAANTNRFIAYRVSDSGISQDPVISVGGIMIHQPPNLRAFGALKASPDGQMLAIAGVQDFSVQLFRFNDATGVVSDPIELPTVYASVMGWGVSFSPDNSKLYAAMAIADRNNPGEIESGLMQFELSTWDSAAIINSRFVVRSGGRGEGWGLMQLGPDHRLYIAGRSYVDIVDAPNARGNACRYRSPGLIVRSDLELPNLIDGYIMGPRVPFAPDAGRDAVVCRGDSVRLAASGGTSFQWSPTIGLSCSDCATPFASPSQTTTYHVAISNGIECSAIDSVTVVVHAAPAVDAGTSRNICIGDTAQLRATGGVVYRWTPTVWLNCSDCPDPISRARSTTLYRVTVTDSNGCDASDTVTVTVSEGAIADAGPSRTICPGDSAMLDGGNASSYRWLPATGLSCADCRNPFASPAVSTTYTLTIANEAGCVASDTTTVFVRQPDPMMVSADTTICAGDSVQLRVTSGAPCRWSPAIGLSCADCAEPFASPSTTTMYHVTSTDTVTGCIVHDSVRVTVFSSATVDAGPATTICAGNSTRLLASDGITWRWSPADGLSCIDCRDPFARPTATTVYEVTVQGPGGCIGSDTVSVTVSAPPTVDAGIDVRTCAGVAVQLQATGALSYRWSPSPGLSCADCSNPIANPVATETFYVEGIDANGCIGIDSVSVIVDEQRTVRGSIGRDHRVMAGSNIMLPLTLDEPVNGGSISDLVIELGYRASMVRVLRASTEGTLLAAWNLTVEPSDTGAYRVRAIAPPGMSLSGAGRLMNIELIAYITDSMSTEFTSIVELNDQGCERIEMLPGSLTIDSICGLGMRLIELATFGGSLAQSAPNPAAAKTSIALWLAHASHVRLEVFNSTGTSIATLVDNDLAKGTHEILWDVSQTSPGIYYYRVTADQWSSTRRLSVVR